MALRISAFSRATVSGLSLYHCPRSPASRRSLLGPTVRRERPILLLSAVATLSGLTVSGRESTIVPSARPNGERLDRPVLGSWIDAQGLPQMIVNRGVNHVNSTFSTGRAVDSVYRAAVTAPHRLAASYRVTRLPQRTRHRRDQW